MMKTKININWIKTRNNVSVTFYACVCVCVCVCAIPFTVKASSARGYNSRGQINNVVLKMFLSSAKFPHRYFSMKHRVFLTSHFILFTR